MKYSLRKITHISYPLATYEPS